MNTVYSILYILFYSILTCDIVFRILPLYITLYYIVSVSYTHLDVYKRQPLFLLPGGVHSITLLSNLSYAILFACPYHCNYFVWIKSTIEFFTLIISLTSSFLIFSRLDTLAERLQKSISAVIIVVLVCLLVVQTYEP